MGVSEVGGFGSSSRIASPLILHGPQPPLTPHIPKQLGRPPNVALVDTAGGCYVRAAALEKTGRQGQSAATAIVPGLTRGAKLRRSFSHRFASGLWTALIDRGRR